LGPPTMSGEGPKQSFSGMLLFSMLAGVFCALVSVTVAAILTDAGTIRQAGLKDFLIPAGAAFVVAFAATLASNYYGLSWWLIKDQMAGRVGPWQRAPAWFTRLTNRLIGDRGSKRHKRP
jgi:hypothetical protein